LIDINRSMVRKYSQYFQPQLQEIVVVPYKSIYTGINYV